MLSQDSTSYNYVKTFLDSDRKIAIIKTGYISSESYGNELLNRWKGQNDRLFDISLSAHADFEEIYTLISELEPKHIVCVHGDGLKSAFKPDVVSTTVEDASGFDAPTKETSDGEELEQTVIAVPIEETIDDDKNSNKAVDDMDSHSVDDDDDDENPQSGTVTTVDSKVLAEIFAQPNNFIISLIIEFVDAYNHTEKTNRNAQRSDKNARMYDAYYSLYSFVRLHAEYTEFYKELFSLGVKRKRVYSYLKTIIRIHEGLEQKAEEESIVNNNPIWDESSILYVHKGTIICQRDNHNVVTATAVLLGKNDQTIELTVNYCKDCKRFFINYISYEAYRNKYGVLIGNIVLEDEDRNIFSDVVLAEASPLKLCGYSVNQQDGYSKETRWYIISKIIDRGIMSKSEVIRYLEYFININGRKKSNQLALSKWKEDLKFTLSYESSKQERHFISEIKRYPGV